MSLGMMEACCNKREREKACVCCACEPDVIIPLCMCVRSVMRTRFVGLFAMCFVMCVCICRMIICFLTIFLTGSCIKLLTSILFFTHTYTTCMLIIVSFSSTISYCHRHKSKLLLSCVGKGIWNETITPYSGEERVCAVHNRVYTAFIVTHTIHLARDMHESG